MPFILRPLISRLGGDKVGEMFALATSHLIITIAAGFLQSHSEVRTSILGMRLRGAVSHSEPAR